MRKRKGSSSVFLVMVLGSMITLVMAFVSVSLRVGAIGYTDGISNLAARSVLSEFDNHLKDDYGLFAFRGHRMEIETKIGDYLAYTFDRNKYLDLESVEANTAGYSLADVDIFEKEVCEYAKYALARGWIKDALDGEEGAGKKIDTRAEGRTLRNHKIIDVLPSGATPGGGGIVSSVKSLANMGSGGLTQGTNAYLVTQYIMNTFKNAQEGNERKTFFRNEVEYILEGEMSDQLNRREVRRDIRKVRNAINLLFIFTNPKLRSELLAAAQVMGLEVGTPIAAAAIAEAWAFAEAENDVRLLEHGRKVPLYKTNDTWAIDIQSIIDNKESEYIDTNSPTGLTYQGYLQIFLFVQERNVRLGRMMDLMQINIVGNYDSSFLIREHNMGLWTKIKVDGREYSYDHKY